MKKWEKRLRQPDQFVCISYSLVDFLIPGDDVLSAVGVEDFGTDFLMGQDSGIFDFEEIASKFTDDSLETNVKTMMVLKGENDTQMFVVTAHECRLCTVKLDSFSLFTDFYSDFFKSFGLLACNFVGNRIQFLLDVGRIIKYLNDTAVRRDKYDTNSCG